MKNFLAFCVGLSLAVIIFAPSAHAGLTYYEWQATGRYCWNCPDPYGVVHYFCERTDTDLYVYFASSPTKDMDGRAIANLSTSYCTEPTEPETCSDGVFTFGSEDGIDCGGECEAACVVGCPNGMIETVDTATGETLCYSISPHNKDGSCPAGYDDLGDVCGLIDTPVVGNSDIVGTISNDDVAAADSDLQISDLGTTLVDFSEDFDVEENTSIEGGTFSVVPSGDTSVSTTETTDNGDGTTTTITVTTDTSIDGDVTKTTKTTTTDTSTGLDLGTTIVTTGSSEPDTSGSYSFDYGADNVYDSELGELPDETKPMEVISTANLPFAAILDTYSVSLSNTQCSVAVGNVWGVDLAIDMCRFDDVLRGVGAVLLVATQGLAVFIALFGWKGGE